MHKRVRAIIIQDKKLLTIRRFKNNEIYFVLLGGGVEDGEDYRGALARECLEEANVEVVVGDCLFKQEFNGSEESFYRCNIVGGLVGRGDGAEYRQISDDNSYEPVWLSLENILENNIKPREIINIIAEL
jgi:ADP-ribose pyrophosphatase YjhB (NUDIX family)